jgi:alcohol dehydrogenase (cytochrome c)
MAVRLRRRSRIALSLLLAAFFAVLALSSALAKPAADANVGWGGFGNTPDENRYSPLAQIDAANVHSLGRLFTLDFRALDPTTRLGEQSYPVEQNGTLYMTTNDDNVWALDATTGAVKWRWTPNDVAVFQDYGIVANRGVALCDGHVFVLTLDMNIVSLDPATGALQRKVPIAAAVPGASVHYGYSETSAPICADNHLIIGAAGSEYGVRGFVMAYNTNLTPAWPNPFWTIPPAGTEWRRLDPLAGGGVVWTPTTVDPTTNTLYFGTSTATPYYFPSIRPGSDPRSDSLIAVNLATGRLKWWQQQMTFNEWHYDTSQPPLVYTAKIGGKAQRVVSVATMEGLWFAYNAQTGRPIYQQVKVLDHTEHPNLQPGKPVVVFPSSIGGLNYSPASFDPQTDYVYNAAAETASVETQAVLTPAEKKDKFSLGDVFLGLSNGNYGQIDPGYRDYGSIDAINLDTGTIAWKDQTPQAERGGITTTAGGLGFDGDGDGNLRVFNVQTGQILWKFQTGHQIASGPSLYSVNGTEYVAITVGGTPTSSAGGTATQLQVFALGGSSSQSSAPVIPATAASVRAPAPTAQPAAAHKPSRHPSVQHQHVASAGTARIVTSAPVVVQPWQPNTSNVAAVTGRVLWNGAPVVGADVMVDAYQVPQATNKTGSFSYDLDDTVAGRHVVRVSGLAHATVNGKRLTAAEQRSITAASGGFSSAFAISGLHAKVQKNGSVLISGKVADASHAGPPGVHLLTYQLTGTITNSFNQPVKGAYLVTRTLDRDFWTRSDPSNGRGEYFSFFPASDETNANPVIMSVGVAFQKTSYGGVLGTNVPFVRLHSSVLNVQLGNGPVYKISTPTPYAAAIYSGLTVGVTFNGRVIIPLSARWPDAKGNFSLVLPSYVRGKTLNFFESQAQFVSRFVASPGASVDLKGWPTTLAATAPAGLGAFAVSR